MSSEVRLSTGSSFTTKFAYPDLSYAKRVAPEQYPFDVGGSEKLQYSRSPSHDQLSSLPPHEPNLSIPTPTIPSGVPGQEKRAGRARGPAVKLTNVFNAHGYDDR